MNKPTTVELCILPVYRRLAVAEFFKVHNVEIVHVTLTTPTYIEHSLITRLRLRMADPCTTCEVSSVSRCGEITRGVKF